MAEPTLAAAYADLLGDVGFFLGFGRGTAFNDPDWTAQQKATIDRCVKGGLRKVYHCGHDWSFLRPVVTLQVDSGKNTVALPDDCGGVEGEVTVSATSTIVWYPVQFTGVGRVYQQQAQCPTTTGRPQLCCVEPALRPTAGQGQRFQLRLWPTADAAYTLKFQYYLNPEYLSGAFPYLYGGAQHAETFLAAAKATAELDLDDIADGPQQAEFLRLLEVSKDIDRRNKPQVFGYNRDLSDHRARNRWGWPGQHGDALITVNGVQY
jgi:hypothetical protein